MMDRRYALAALIYCAIIFYESSHAIPYKVDQMLPGIDKIVHACIYGTLAAIVSIGMRKSGREYTPRVQFVVPILVAMMIVVCRRDVMGQFVANRGQRIGGWLTTAMMTAASVAMFLLM